MAAAMIDAFPYIAYVWGISFVAFSLGALFWLFGYWRDALAREFFRERVASELGALHRAQLKEDFRTLVSNRAEDEPKNEVMSALSNVVARYAVNKEDVIPIIRSEPLRFSRPALEKSVRNIFFSLSIETPEGKERMKMFATNYLLQSHWRLDDAPFLGRFLAGMLLRATQLYSDEVIHLIARRAGVHPKGHEKTN